MENKKEGKKLNIVIVGTGLIGCSIADGLKDLAEDITGVDNNAGHLQEALYRGLISRGLPLEKAVSNADVVIITVPVDATVRLLPRILDDIDEKSVVIDAGSVKAAICKIVEQHPKRQQFVAAHPMAGLAVSGPEAADAHLFLNRKVIICEQEKSSAPALNIASSIFEKLGMGLLYMTPDVHDICVAQVSHLPQVIAYGLSALTAEHKGDNEFLTKVAATGFESSTRLASSPADMWIPIMQLNNEKLSDSLDDMITMLSEIRNMIKIGKWDALTGFIGKANKAREEFLNDYKQK